MVRKSTSGIVLFLFVIVLVGCGKLESQDVSTNPGISIARRGSSLITPTPINNQSSESESMQNEGGEQNPPLPVVVNSFEQNNQEPKVVEDLSSTPTLEPNSSSVPSPATPEIPEADESEAGLAFKCTVELNRNYDTEVIRLINEERKKEGLTPLLEQTQLTQAARLHSEDMGCNRFFGHLSPSTGDVLARVASQGYQYSAIGENLAAGYMSPESVVRGWLESTGHRANILSKNFTQIGVGYAFVEGSDSGYYWTLLIGTP